MQVDAALARRIEFWQYVDYGGTGCWLWQLKPGTSGYGSYSFDIGQRDNVHVLVWKWLHGAVPGGCCVQHQCDVKLCVRPSHLLAAPYSKNISDMWKRGLVPNGTRIRKLDDADRELALRSYASGISISQLATQFDVTRAALYCLVNGYGKYYKYLDPLREELGIKQFR